MPSPARIAWNKKTECMASLTTLLPLNEKETLLTPPEILTPGQLSVINFEAVMKSTA